MFYPGEVRRGQEEARGQSPWSSLWGPIIGCKYVLLYCISKMPRRETEEWHMLVTPPMLWPRPRLLLLLLVHNNQMGASPHLGPIEII